MTNDALVDDVVFAVRAGLVDAARVIDRRARLEQLSGGTDFANDSGDVPPKYPRHRCVRIGSGADLVVDGVDRDCSDFDQQLAL
jgi:hypothetical protein